MHLKKWLKVTLISLGSSVVLLAAVFWIYVSDYNHADDMAVTALADAQTLTQ